MCSNMFSVHDDKLPFRNLRSTEKTTIPKTDVSLHCLFAQIYSSRCETWLSMQHVYSTQLAFRKCVPCKLPKIRVKTIGDINFLDTMRPNRTAVHHLASL